MAQEGHTQRVTLPQDGAAEITVNINPGPATVYAYCNLHGLWSAEG
ncbi:MAG: class II SORL domain-containing protein [Clostridiales bacterium]|nr:class II SORL domain-containing protein [Clostridiales bacterium]